MRLEDILTIIFLVQTYAIVNNNPSMSGCPTISTTMDNFTLERFSGVWYEIQKISSQFESGTCVSIDTVYFNPPIATIKHSQKIGTNFTDFYQNATVLTGNSVWYFKFNRSITGK